MFDIRRDLALIALVLILLGIGVVVAIVIMPASPRDQAAQFYGPNAITTSDKPSSAVPAEKVVWSDDFSSGKLDPARWEEVVNGDFREKLVDVVDGRLRLRADTVSTDDRTVKSLGVRTVEKFKLPATISVTLDWNKQTNGSYLSAGIGIDGNHGSGLKAPGGEYTLGVEYIGVPPGKNGRLEIFNRFKGRYPLFNEGWPERQKEGREIGIQEVKVEISKTGYKVWENGKLMFEREEAWKEREVTFSLYMTSHSNYPAREIYFDDISVTSE
jgi:hypothetical protein